MKKPFPRFGWFHPSRNLLPRTLRDTTQSAREAQAYFDLVLFQDRSHPVFQILIHRQYLRARDTTNAALYLSAQTRAIQGEYEISHRWGHHPNASQELLRSHATRKRGDTNDAIFA